MNHLKILKEHLDDYRAHPLPDDGFPFITISRQAGAGGHLLLIALLAKTYHGFPMGASPDTAALANGLRPLVCVGELLAEREAGKTEAVVTGQVRGSLAGFDKNQILETVIAYEPVWAIGTGKTASPAQAQEVHALIRRLLGELFGADVAGKVRIQYGGSVKADNAKELLGQSDIDGALVGGASLKAGDFAAIVKATV